jgi:IPT/TIG domain
MAVPTITSVSPVKVLTAGNVLITIRGTNFRVPTSLPTLGPTMSVLFGSSPATDVSVLATDLLVALCPSREAGTVSVVVTNLDDAGDPIAGETVTLANALAFEMPKHTREYEHDLTRLVRTVLRRLKLALHTNITRRKHTDATDEASETISILAVGKFPSVIVFGPRLAENRFYSTNGRVEVSLPDGSFAEMKQPTTVDVFFKLLAVTDNDSEMLNIMGNLVAFMASNKYLYFQRIANDPSAGETRFEFDFAPNGYPDESGGSNESNVHQFNAEIMVRAFDIEDWSGLIPTTSADNGGITGNPSIPVYLPGTGVPVTNVVAQGEECLELELLNIEQMGDDEDP